MILVVDDELGNRAFVHRVLSRAAWTVTMADSGAAATRALTHNMPDLIIMDINMPQMDGWMTAQIIRARPAPICTVPILAFTSMAVNDHMVRARGMDGWLPKPCTDDTLLQIVAKWRPEGVMDGVDRLAAVFGGDQVLALVAGLRGQLTDALARLDTDSDRAALAHRIGGAAGTLGFRDVSDSWLRLSEGDTDALEDARRDARIAIFEIDRRMQRERGDSP